MTVKCEVDGCGRPAYGDVCMYHETLNTAKKLNKGVAHIAGKPTCRMTYCYARVDVEGDLCLRCEKLVADAEAEAQEEDV
ncbi:hypothetical protein GOV11_00885 [Candidatus Woesearchaeota archaeon]|nr:hypothetical protein [Candidatus Woesearchaeota archaeon]